MDEFIGMNHSHSVQLPQSQAHHMMMANGSQHQQPVPNQPVDTVKVTGTLKFFYETDHYGFLVGDSDGKDVFFHFDDMKDTNLSKAQLFLLRESYTVRFAYNKLAYFGRYGLSMKAINIELVEMIQKQTASLPIIQP